MAGEEIEQSAGRKGRGTFSGLGAFTERDDRAGQKMSQFPAASGAEGRKAVKKLLVPSWLLVPVAVLALHYGPGQRYLAWDRAADVVRRAEAAVFAEDWDAAVSLYTRAIDLWPADDPAGRDRLEAHQAAARMARGEMIEGQEQLQKLLTRLEANPDQDPELRKTVSAELAAASYYTAWVMRLEGATAEEWKPEAEQARQQFRLLAERAAAGGDVEAEALAKNLEATVRLEHGPRHAQGQAAAQEVQRLQESQPTQTPAVPGPLEGPSEETRRGRPEDDPEDQQRGPERTPGRWIMIAVTAHRHRKGTGTFFGLARPRSARITPAEK